MEGVTSHQIALEFRNHRVESELRHRVTNTARGEATVRVITTHSFYRLFRVRHKLVDDFALASQTVSKEYMLEHVCNLKFKIY